MKSFASRLARALAILWDPRHEEHLFALRSMDEATRVRCAALGIDPDDQDVPKSEAWEGAYDEVAKLRRKYSIALGRIVDLEQSLTEAEARAAGHVSWRRGRIEA